MTAPTPTPANDEDAGAALYRDNNTTPAVKTGTDIAPNQEPTPPIVAPEQPANG